MPTRIFYGWWIVLAGFVLTFLLSSIVFFGFTAFFEPLVQEFGWSHTQVSLAASLRGLEMGIFSPIFGYLVDRFGSRKIAVLGVIVSSVGLFLLSTTETLLMFYASFLLLGIGAGACTSIVSFTAVANWFSRDIGKALGIVSAGFGASGLLIPLIVFLIDLQGWRDALVTMSLILLVAGLPAAIALRDRPEKYGLTPYGISTAKTADTGKIKPTKIGFRDTMRHKSFWYLNVSECLRLMALSAVVIHIMPFLSSLSIPRATAGFITAGIPLVSILGRFGLGWLGDVREKRKVVALAYALMAAGVVSLYFAQSAFFLLIFLFSFSVGFGGVAVVRSALILEYYGRENFGKTLGVIMGAGALGGVVGPTLTGFIYDLHGNYHAAWVIFFFILVICFFLSLKTTMPTSPRS